MKSLTSRFLLSVLSVALGSISLGQAEDGPRDVRNIGLSGGGVITNIALSPIDSDVTLLATNMGGVFLTDDGPKKWKMIHHCQLRYSWDCSLYKLPADPREQLE